MCSAGNGSSVEMSIFYAPVCLCQHSAPCLIFSTNCAQIFRIKIFRLFAAAQPTGMHFKRLTLIPGDAIARKDHRDLENVIIVLVSTFFFAARWTCVSCAHKHTPIESGHSEWITVTDAIRLLTDKSNGFSTFRFVQYVIQLHALHTDSASGQWKQQQPFAIDTMLEINGNFCFLFR